MSLSDVTPDMIVQQRRLRRRLTLWRVLAILAIVAAGAILFGALAGSDGVRGPHIARLSIGGLITSDKGTQELLGKLAEDENVAALILDIDSPGGTTAGSEALYLALREVAAKKPVVSTVSNTAASGAYIAAMGSDHIVARGNAIVGSVGVIFQWPDVTELLEELGIDLRAIKSSPLKAEPDLTEPTPPEAIETLEAMVADTQDWFTGLVRERRDIAEDRFDLVTSGRVFTGRQSLELGLIDAIGGEAEARAYLATRDVDADLEIADREPESAVEDVPWLRALASAALREIGLPVLADALRGVSQSRGLVSLDGLLAVWHPSLASPR
ncbi:MAG: signal peptide peptidase SppA [Pseudomonadota bacterium]